jgi:hypothetical protein
MSDIPQINPVRIEQSRDAPTLNPFASSEVEKPVSTSLDTNGTW